MIYDRISGIALGDPEIKITDGSSTDESLQKTLSSFILSASGWRCVVTASGDEEDSCEDVNEDMLLFAAASALSFFRYLNLEKPRILLGREARPTGRLLAESIRRALLSLGASVYDIAISSAPEIMAFSHKFDGFFYISASHNPVGHNGFKFGTEGGVLPKEECDKAIQILKETINRNGSSQYLRSLIDNADSAMNAECLMVHDRIKRKALDYYASFVMKTAAVKKDFTLPFGVVIDFNGSARSVSIDIPFLRSKGAKLWVLNSIPGQIEHAIVPEGKNLERARKALEEIHRKDSSFILGYTPDNDGDRGNFVYIKKNGKAEIMSAQTVFALVSLIEAAYDRMNGRKNIALAVNGPTSLLVDDIAARLGVSVFRGDIGEANVVEAARRKREEGYCCRVCGEGSNGGNITYPAKVRDPMNSLMTFAKLFSSEGLYSFIMKALGKKEGKEISLYSVIEALPPYMTTSAFSSDAVMKIKSTDYNRLREEYERIVANEADSNLPAGTVRWEERQYEGSDETIGMGKTFRTPESTGGVKIQFYDENGPAGYLWLSKSRTEPVIRTMVDIKGSNKELHDKLLEWQHSMVERADRASM